MISGMTKLNKWQTKSSKIVYKNPWITVKEDQVINPEGKPTIYAYMRVGSGRSVFILPEVEKAKFVLVKQRRYALGGKESLEFPAGNADDDSPEQAAHRELQEETGYKAEELKLIGTTDPFNSVVRETQFTFLATGLTQTNEHKMAEDGISGIVILSEQEIIEKIRSGKIMDGQCIAAWYLYQLSMDR